MPSVNVGSSPRMRGALLIPIGERYGIGIIPAYAGSTVVLYEADGYTRDHPRVCGEHTKVPRAI